MKPFLFVACLLVSCLCNAEVWLAPPEVASQFNPVRYDVDSVMKGKALYREHCQECHGYWAEGDGDEALKTGKAPANLLRIAGKQSEGAFAWKIMEGRGDMPAFKDIFSQEEVWHLVNFISSMENEPSPTGKSPD